MGGVAVEGKEGGVSMWDKAEVLLACPSEVWASEREHGEKSSMEDTPTREQ